MVVQKFLMRKWLNALDDGGLIGGSSEGLCSSD
jgi:hypothetical protein